MDEVDYGDRYEWVKEVGKGSYGVAELMRDRETGELVVCKYIERGDRVSRRASSPQACPESACLAASCSSQRAAASTALSTAFLHLTLLHLTLLRLPASRCRWTRTWNESC